MIGFIQLTQNLFNASLHIVNKNLALNNVMNLKDKETKTYNLTKKGKFEIALKMVF